MNNDSHYKGGSLKKETLHRYSIIPCNMVLSDAEIKETERKLEKGEVQFFPFFVKIEEGKFKDVITQITNMEMKPKNDSERYLRFEHSIIKYPEDRLSMAYINDEYDKYEKIMSTILYHIFEMVVQYETDNSKKA